MFFIFLHIVCNLYSILPIKLIVKYVGIADNFKGLYYLLCINKSILDSRFRGLIKKFLRFNLLSSHQDKYSFWTR